MSSLSPSQQPTVLFSIYQNDTWTISRLVDETIDPATQCIILKIVGFQMEFDGIAKLPFSDACMAVENNKNINSFEIIMTLVTIVQMVLIL